MSDIKYQISGWFLMSIIIGGVFFTVYMSLSLKNKIEILDVRMEKYKMIIDNINDDIRVMVNKTGYFSGKFEVLESMMQQWQRVLPDISVDYGELIEKIEWLEEAKLQKDGLLLHNSVQENKKRRRLNV